MTAAGWIQVGDGYRRGVHEITPVGPYDGRGWLLRSVEGVRRFVAAGPRGLQYESLTSAKNFASHYELESVRRAKQVRHGALGCGLGTAAVWLMWLASLGEPGTVTSLWLGGFLLFFVAMRELVYLFAVTTKGDYYYHRHELGTVDLLVNRTIVTLVRSRPWRHRRMEESVTGTVAIMPIDLDEFRFPGD